MYNPTFGQTALRRHLRKNDYKKRPFLKISTAQDTLLERAAAIGSNGFKNLNFRTSNLAGRTIYQLVDLESELVLRKATQNVSKILKTKQSNRIEIIRRIRLLCEEGMPFCLGRFDIRQFYESIDQHQLEETFNRRLATSPSTRKVLSTFMQECRLNGVNGLPQGLAISAVLSELYMSSFDEKVPRELNTHFYARYVDDILMLLPPRYEAKRLKKHIVSMLPTGLSLNEKKTRILSFSEKTTANGGTEHKFDYLGFSFCVTRVSKAKKNRAASRRVTIDIAQSKVAKRKTRVVRALLQYLSDHKYADLVDRFKIITCNYRFYDHRNGKLRLAGNSHGYGLIDLPSQALDELDRFVKHILLSRSGKIGAQLAQALPKSRSQRLLRLSFKRGFESKTYFHFSPNRLNYLIKCWKYV